MKIILSMVLASVLLAGCDSGSSQTRDVKRGAHNPASRGYAGLWIGQEPKEYHVASVLVQKDEFPCECEIKVQARDGGVVTMSGLLWQKTSEGLVAIPVKGTDVVVRASLSRGMLSGIVSVPLEGSLDPSRGTVDLAFKDFHR